MGRLDKILSRFELDNNTEHYISDFLRALHEAYSFKSSAMLGDTGQVIILGGKEKDGLYYKNQYTYLIIKCLKELKLPDPKCILRVSDDTPKELCNAAIECIATGIGSPLISNDEVVIPALQDFGYSIEDSYNYGVSACWEPLIIGKSLEQNNLANIEFGKSFSDFANNPTFVDIESYDEILSQYKKHLKISIQEAINKINAINWEYDPLLTLLTIGCIDNNKDVSEGGAVYNNYGILSVGIASAVNSLLNIKKYVFEERIMTLSDVQTTLKCDYQNNIQLEKRIKKNENGFGTDSEEAIELTNELVVFVSQELENYRNKFGGKVKFGLSSPNYMTKGMQANATFDGRRAKQAYETHISRDKGDSITSIIKFASELNYCGCNSNANVVNIMIQPSLILEMADKFYSLLITAIKLRVFQLQFNVVSYQQLLEARKSPEKFPDLIVRVWGFSAYFNDLSDDYKDLLIERAKQNEESV